MLCIPVFIPALTYRYQANRSRFNSLLELVVSIGIWIVTIWA
jgi:hypothetical protein